MDSEATSLAARLLDMCRRQGWTLATAESCTGGLLSGALTATPGASDVFGWGFVTYANAAKTGLLGVPAAMLAEHGAVSAPVATAMAEGALRRSGADMALSITGVAGPGASEAKPAGLVHFGCAVTGSETRVARHQFTGDRRAVRGASVRAALELGLEAAGRIQVKV